MRKPRFWSWCVCILWARGGEPKNRIIEEIIRVAELISADPDAIKKLRDAQNETQFSKALQNVRDAVPQSLLVRGQNPLSLLHSALSDGLHEKDDQTCLELAHAIRVILGELSERIAQALKDERELTDAVARLVASGGPPRGKA